MTVEIPAWLLWTLALVLGVPTVIAILGFAVFGVMFVRAFAPRGRR